MCVGLIYIGVAYSEVCVLIMGSHYLITPKIIASLTKLNNKQDLTILQSKRKTGIIRISGGETVG